MIQHFIRDLQVWWRSHDEDGQVNPLLHIVGVIGACGIIHIDIRWFRSGLRFARS
eukprot:NODE_25648_length_579_cov_10.351770.p2 GENE.NODE_25648_length_579_cov_10.351770~~NODE_25648_length_579_cov_10.351770.p2  ORF type:complete len:55 (+),score=4.59 NODE_25648_length_579_cov_10.351770:94-258(+)